MIMLAAAATTDHLHCADHANRIWSEVPCRSKSWLSCLQHAEENFIVGSAKVYSFSLKAGESKPGPAAIMPGDESA
jgi:hypothetical protein